MRATQRLNIIVGNRSERVPLLMEQLEQNGITNYELWDGIYKYDSAKENINAAHKQIVYYAKIAEFSEVVIAEDDLVFTHPDSWKHFTANDPADYDVYLGGCYSPVFNTDNTLKSFCGLHLYSVHERFYDTFLSLPKHEHIDRSMEGFGRFILADPMVAIQRNGFSSNTGKDENYDQLLNGRKLFGS